jgi:hypothetical protein
MAYIGKNPTSVPLTSSDLADNIVTVDKLATTLDLSSNTVTLPSGVGGKVLQVVSVTKSDTFSNTGAAMVDVTGLSLSITPSSASNKVYLFANVSISANVRYLGFKFVRDTTDIGVGDAEGSRARITVSSHRNQSATNDDFVMHNSSATFLDSPSTTSAITYKIKAGTDYESSTLYINRPSQNPDGIYIHRGISTITAYEIAG